MGGVVEPLPHEEEEELQFEELQDTHRCTYMCSDCGRKMEKMETIEKILLGMEPTTFLQGDFGGGRRQVERLKEGGTERRMEGEKVTLWSFSALSHSVSTYEL